MLFKQIRKIPPIPPPKGGTKYKYRKSERRIKKEDLLPKMEKMKRKFHVQLYTRKHES